MNKIFIDINKICNLSRVPISIDCNPLVKTATKIINKKKEDAYNILKNYYNSLNYNNLNDLHNTDIKKLSDYNYYDFFLPWYHTQPVQKFRDDTFITAINKEKIKEKIKKIENLIKSIKSKGYNPETFLDRKLGHITGYFLEIKNNKKFYVVSGNHRVAVLYALGYKKIPVVFENYLFFKDRDKVNFGWEKMPSSFTDLEAELWPSVNNGFLTKKEALEITKSYFI